MQLDLPVPKALTLDQNFQMLRAAVTHAPQRADLRVELARLCVQLDRFEEALHALDGVEPPAELAFVAAMTEGSAYLARETAADDNRATLLFERAEAHAPSSLHRAAALANLGKSQTRRGLLGVARQTLDMALALDACNPNALKRRTVLDLCAHEDQEVLERCDAMQNQGVRHARLLGDRYLALSLLGKTEEASALEGLSDLLCVREPGTPNGYSSGASFRSALAEELAQHPGLRFERYGTASTASWRIDDPVLMRSRVLPALLELLVREILDYDREFVRAEGDHPFRHARPTRAQLRPWAIIANSRGFEEWHLHQGGWLSGVYYVDIPTAVSEAKNESGCIEFGSPELAHIPRSIPGRRQRLRPRAGQLLLFPSHAYHHTFPSGCDARRMCVAFDVIPTDA